MFNHHRHLRDRRWRLVAATAMSLATVVVGAAAASPALAKGGDDAGSVCASGGFHLINTTTGATVNATSSGVALDASLFGAGGKIGVRGRYVEFDVRLSDFATLDYTFTGAANAGDLTGGVRTPVFASKVPDLRGVTLSSTVSASIDKDGLSLSRTGPGVSMKITANDCAQGGIYQMEPERADGTRTRIVHTLAQGAGAQTPFYYDNPNFRAKVGQFLGADCTSVTTGPASQFCVKVTTRVNIGNSSSAKFVARDSSQVATRITQADCNTTTPLTPSAAHCGSQSVWDVASGGRLGFVTGEDATEVANPPTVCTHQCQAQNQVRGRLANLGFPFPVPTASRLTPAVSALPLPALSAP